MSIWSELPHEMLVIISELFESPKDFVRFGAVCKSWQAAAHKEYFKGLCFRQGIPPYLMLPVRDDKGEARELYSLIEHKIVDSVKVPNFKTKKCLESLGWLLATDVDGSMSLVDLFSGMEIQLPHQETFPDYDSLDEHHVFVQKMVLSARPNEMSDFVLMGICGELSHLAFWRTGDTAWNWISRREGSIDDVVYHNGQFYAIGHPGVVYVINIDPHDNRAEARIIALFSQDLPHPLHGLLISKTLYNLKICDCLYFITRTQRDLCTGEFNDEPRFRVYEVDASTYPGSIKEIHSLGTMAVFLGHNATTAVDASTCDGIIKPNHIYFTDDNWEFYYFHEAEGAAGGDMGVYSLDTREVEPFYHGELLLNKVSTTTWITPYFPQFT